jgi:hypothetical protein
MRRRGRGQHRKPSQHHHHHHGGGRNQTFDSNGPGVRLRGTAHQIYEKYLTLGRDSAASGDRIMSENYFQHADHYYRIILANQGPLEQFSERQDGGEPEMEAETNGYGQGEQPGIGDGQPQQAYGNTLPQTQGYNGGGPSQGTSLPGGGNQPRPESEGQGQGQGGHQGQHHGGFRRDRFRRFRDRRDDRGGDRQGNYAEGGERRDDRREGDRPEGQRQEGHRHEGNRRDDRPRDNRDGGRDGSDRRQQRPHEDDAFEPPAFLKAERPANEPPRDPFNRDDEQR